MNVHFIAIGGSAMHNLAIALCKKGYTITGSDDEIFEPSRTNLEKYGILPEKIGWDDSKITEDLDAVILGMHAREDNPELIKAKKLNLKIYSYPEYIYEQSKDKIRIVIGGSHGKTTITSMIIHVLNQNKINCDYLVGAQLEGFDNMVKLSNDAKYIVIEGDEYLSSPIDRRPKFHLYKPHIAVLSGIAWDHINVFPTFDNYIEQFRIFSKMIEKGGTLIYYEKDNELIKIAAKLRKDINQIPYSTHPFEIIDNVTYLLTEKASIKLKIFGEHNLQNINAAKNVCEKLLITPAKFYNAIKTFKGASKRLQLLKKNKNTSVFLDFAHSPSKLKATIDAVKHQYPERELIACLELHTFSSLRKDFLFQYYFTMRNADVAFVFFDPHVVKNKRLDSLTPEFVAESFGGNNIKVFVNSKTLITKLFSFKWENKNLLLMSSGNFSGVNFKELADLIVK